MPEHHSVRVYEAGGVATLALWLSLPVCLMGEKCLAGIAHLDHRQITSPGCRSYCSASVNHHVRDIPVLRIGNGLSGAEGLSISTLQVPWKERSSMLVEVLSPESLRVVLPETQQ